MESTAHREHNLGANMKVKLKKGEKLSSNMNYCGLELDDWTAPNQGKQVEMDFIPEKIKEQVDGASAIRKGDK